MAVTLIGVFVTVASFAWGIVRWVLGEFSKRDTMIQAESARAKMIEDNMKAELSAHKLYAAQHFATEGSLSAAVQRVETVIRQLTDRLDRYFEHRTPPGGGI